MTREEKAAVIDSLTEKFKKFNYFYVTDTSALSAGEINSFRRLCYEKGVDYEVVKNTLIAKALVNLGGDYAEFTDKVLRGASGIIFSETGNLPAKMLKEFKKKTGVDKIVFKGASIDTAAFIGSDQLDALVALKSKQELIGEIIGLLQSPAKNVISALLSGEQKLAGIVKTLSERES